MRRCAKPAASASGCGGHARSSSSRLFAMGQYSMARCTGRADTTMHSAPAAKVTKRQYASLAFNWIRILFGRWNIGHPMTITAKGSVVDRPRRIPKCEYRGKMSPVSRNQQPFQPDFETRMFPMVCGIIPECGSASLRYERSPSPESRATTGIRANVFFKIKLGRQQGRTSSS